MKKAIELLRNNTFYMLLITITAITFTQCSSSNNTSENDPDNPTLDISEVCVDADEDGYYAVLSSLSTSSEEDSEEESGTEETEIDTSSLDPDDYPCLDEEKVDCDDYAATIYPGATETENDGIDQDCDGEDSGCGTDLTITYYEDSDGDGYGNLSGNKTTLSYGCEEEAPSAPSGYTSDYSDCDDSSASIYPGATETENDGIDQDCDGSDSGSSGGDSSGSDICDYSTTYYQDSDGDGYGLSSATKSVGECEDAPSGYVTNSGDCDDTNAEVHPGATEIEGNSVDDDCDSSTSDSSCNDTTATYYKDSDGDGYGDSSNSKTETISDCMSEESQAPDGYVTDNTDCDDSDSSIHPGATDTAGNGIDEDCSGSDARDINIGNVFDDLKGRTTTEWDSNVIWNGVKFEDTGDKCSQNPNTQVRKLNSYLKDISYDKDQDKLSFSPYNYYYHSSGQNEPYNLKNSYTVIKANKKYLQFYNEKINVSYQSTGTGYATFGSANQPGSISKSCDDYNKCTFTFTQYLSVGDLNGSSIDFDKFGTTNLKAFVVLQGFQLYHDTTRKFRDAHVEVYTPDANIDTDRGTLQIKVITDFNGSSTPKHYDGDVYFTVGVYNPDYVNYATFGSSSSNGTATKSVSLNLSFTPSETSISCSDGCNSEEHNVFIGLRSWGFDLNDHFEVHKIRGFGRLKSFSTSEATMEVIGEAYHFGCSKAATYNLNKLRGRVIICKSDNVCKAKYLNTSKSNTDTYYSPSKSVSW